MQSSRLLSQQWALAIYILIMQNKGVLSRELACMIGVTQWTAWMLYDKIRRSLEPKLGYFISTILPVPECIFDAD